MGFTSGCEDMVAMAALQQQSMAVAAARGSHLVVRARWDTSRCSHTGKVQLGLQSSKSFGSLRARRAICSAVEIEKGAETEESSSLNDLEVGFFTALACWSWRISSLSRVLRLHLEVWAWITM